MAACKWGPKGKERWKKRVWDRKRLSISKTAQGFIFEYLCSICSHKLHVWRKRAGTSCDAGWIQSQISCTRTKSSTNWHTCQSFILTDLTLQNEVFKQKKYETWHLFIAFTVLNKKYPWKRHTDRARERERKSHANIYTLLCIKLDEKVDDVIIQALNALLVHIISPPHNMLWLALVSQFNVNSKLEGLLT